MDEKIIKKISALFSKLPKKDIEANIEKAKKVLQSAKKEDLQKMINNTAISNLLGKDKESLEKALNCTNFSELDTEKIEEEIHKFREGE